MRGTVPPRRRTRSVEAGGSVRLSAAIDGVSLFSLIIDAPETQAPNKPIYTSNDSYRFCDYQTASLQNANRQIQTSHHIPLAQSTSRGNDLPKHDEPISEQ